VELDTRTFALDHIESWEAAELIAPYVYQDREGAPGTYSQAPGVITIRETEDNLEKIARVLEEFDRTRPDMQLHFQLIEANGARTADPAIAEVEAELRRLFRYEGYRLMGEAFARTTSEGGQFMQEFMGTSPPYRVMAEVISRSENEVFLRELILQDDDGVHRFLTSVRIRIGQTLVLGSAETEDGRSTVILTVRAESAE
jgi:hypothetical protein